LSDFQDHVGLATSMARPRVLHGMPIRDLWAPPQLGRLPTRVAMYFPTPSAAAVDRSLFHRPIPAPFADAVRAVQLPLQSAILLIVAFTYPSSCTLSSHRFESSYLPPPFPPHCNSLLVASSPIHPPLPAMSSRSLRSSTHPCIRRAHRTQRFYFPAFRRPTTNPRIRISTYNSVTASSPVLLPHVSIISTAIDLDSRLSCGRTYMVASDSCINPPSIYLLTCLRFNGHFPGCLLLSMVVAGAL
ncbi:hypothetical protein B0H14DRAFT_2907168, partial [Mycena olivaceomarginata]